ncbi:MAG: DUF4124 domain-containing protein [Granulosicoccaceae bacterium]|jgi:hypothetical protein
MLRAMIMLSLLAMALPVNASLYKCQDAEGNISYTDSPCDNGEELKLPPIPTYTPRPLPASTSRERPQPEAFTYTRLAISKPEQDELIIENTGKLEIAIDIAPALRHLDGHRFVLALDGTRLKTSGTTTRVRIDNVDPGSHTVQAIIVDRDGVELKKSAIVTFYMKRQSILQPQTAPGAPRIPAVPGAPRAPSPVPSPPPSP